MARLRFIKKKVSEDPDVVSNDEHGDSEDERNDSNMDLLNTDTESSSEGTSEDTSEGTSEEVHNPTSENIPTTNFVESYNLLENNSDSDNDSDNDLDNDSDVLTDDSDNDLDNDSNNDSDNDSDDDLTHVNDGTLPSIDVSTVVNNAIVIPTVDDGAFASDATDFLSGGSNIKDIMADVLMGGYREQEFEGGLCDGTNDNNDIEGGADDDCSDAPFVGGNKKATESFKIVDCFPYIIKSAPSFLSE